jgi:hypothetical protein
MSAQRGEREVRGVRLVLLLAAMYLSGLKVGRTWEGTEKPNLQRGDDGGCKLRTNLLYIECMYTTYLYPLSEFEFLSHVGVVPEVCKRPLFYGMADLAITYIGAAMA